MLAMYIGRLFIDGPALSGLVSIVGVGGEQDPGAARETALKRLCNCSSLLNRIGIGNQGKTSCERKR